MADELPPDARLIGETAIGPAPATVLGLHRQSGVLALGVLVLERRALERRLRAVEAEIASVEEQIDGLDRAAHAFRVAP